MLLGTSNMASSKIQQDLNVILENTVLDRVSHTIFLGILIDENLAWKYHIDCVSKILSRNIGIMNKLKYFVPDRLLHTLNCTFILPYINYGILIWGNTCKAFLDKLIKLQNWAIRKISKSHKRSHTQPLFAKYLGVFMYKYSINDLPNEFNDYFTKRFDIHGYKTRRVNDLNLKKKHFSNHSV